MLDVHGALLPVVDPRPAFGVPTPAAHPDQRLIMLSAHTRFLQWVDAADQVESPPVEALNAVTTEHPRSLVPMIARLDGDIVPVLSPGALDLRRLALPAGALPE